MRDKLSIFRRIVQAIGFVVGFGWLIGIPITHIVFPGLHCDYCPLSPWGCPIGMSQRAIAGLGMVPAGGAVIGGLGLMIAAVIAYGVSLGRAWCGWVCPFGTINDIAGWAGGSKAVSRIPSMRLALIPIIIFSMFFFVAGLRWNARLPIAENFFGEGRFFYSIATIGIFVVLTGLALWLYKKRALSFFKYSVLLVIIALSAAWSDSFFCYICPANALEADIPGVAANTNPLSLSNYIYIMSFALVLVGMLLVMRFWCRFLCPFGAFLAIFNRLSLFGLKHNPEFCGFCKSECTQSCPMGMVVVKKQKLNNESAGDCVRCGECIKSCPNSALSFKFGWLKKSASDLSKTEESEKTEE